MTKWSRRLKNECPLSIPSKNTPEQGSLVCVSSLLGAKAICRRPCFLACFFIFNFTQKSFLNIKAHNYRLCNTSYPCLFIHVFWFLRQGSTVPPKCQQIPTLLGQVAKSLVNTLALGKTCISVRPLDM